MHQPDRSDAPIPVEQRGRLAALESAVETVAVLSGGITHDFNNVFQTLVFGIQGGLASLSEDESARAHLQDLRAACDQGVRMVRSVARLAGRPGSQGVVLYPNDAVRALAPSLRRAVGLQEPVELLLDDTAPPVLLSPPTLDGALLIAVIAVHQHAPGPIRIRSEATDAGVELIVEGSGPGAELAPVESALADRPPVVGPRVTLVTRRIREAGGWFRVEASPAGGASVVIGLPRYVATLPASR